MKDLFGGWRGFLKTPSVLEIIKEDLIREFNQADKEGLLASEADFSVSYEIELESRTPLEGRDYDDYRYDMEPELNYEAMRDFIEDMDFLDQVLEEDLDSFLNYDLNIRDVNEMLTAYFEFVHGREPAGSEQEAMLLGLAMDYNESIKDTYEQFINAISSVGKVNKRQRGAKMEWAKKTGQFLKKAFDYEDDPAQQDLFPDADVRGQKMVDWITKNLFDLEDPGAVQKRGEVGIVTLLRNVYSSFYSIGELEDEVGEFYNDFANSGGRWTYVSGASAIGSPNDVFRNKLSYVLAEMVDKKAEEKADERMRDTLEDPESFLRDIYTDYEFEERFMTQPEPEEEEQDDIDLLREHLPNFMARYENVLKFEEDASLQNGVEFSMDNPPYLTGLNEAIEFLKIFFEDFNNQTNWVMSDRTGLHTNVGYIPTVAHEDRDLFKGMLFLNDDMAKRGFEKRKNSRWAMDIKRDALDMVSKGFGDAKVNIGEIIKDEEKMEELRQRLSNSVENSVQGKYVKSLGMNITYLENMDYIEFRYPGQDEPTYQSMVNATLYYAHLIKTINDEDYKKKEYITKLVGFFNNLRAKDLETDRQDLKTARKFFNLPLGTQFAYAPDTSLGSPSANDGLRAWIKVYYENELKPELLKKAGPDGVVQFNQMDITIGEVPDKLESLIFSQLGYGVRIPIFYDGLKKKLNRPDLKGKDKYLIKWIFPREQKSGKPDFRVATQSMGIFVRSLNKFHLSDPEYAIKKSGMEVDLSDPLELPEMGYNALQSIRDSGWRRMAGKQDEGEELDELKFTFTSMNNPVYVKFLRWYKEQYRKWKRGDLEYMTSGGE